MIEHAEPERLPVRRCACGGHDEGTCHCHDDPAGRAGGPAPDIVYRALSSGGRPLEHGVRGAMEQRFGQDLGAVRVHAGDALSGASAAAIGARAYAVGRDVVMGAGYDPADPRSHPTLAHELAHVLQQGARAWAGEPLDVAAADDPAERAAETAAQPLTVARFAEVEPEAYEPVEVEPFPVEPDLGPEPEVEPLPDGHAIPGPPVEPGLRPGPLPAPTPPRYVPPPRSLKEAMDRQARRSKAMRDIAEAERPVATLERGGSPPGFVTTDAIAEGMWSWGQRRHRVRSYHVLDAIEYEVSQARSERELERILRRHTGAALVDVQGRIHLEPFEEEERGPLPLPLLEPLPDQALYKPGFDPGAQARMKTFKEAVEKRGARSFPGLQNIPGFVQLIGPPRRRGRCLIAPTVPLGETLDPVGHLYCADVLKVGGDFEWLVAVPGEGQWAVFDALLGDAAYECKCGYAAVAENERSTSSRRQRYAARDLAAFDVQMRNQDNVCRACGLKLRWYASDSGVAALLNERWGGSPPVIHQASEFCY